MQGGFVRGLVCLLVAIGFAACRENRPPEELARQLIRLTGGQDQVSAVGDVVVSRLSKEESAAFRRAFDANELVDLLVPLYTERFSAEELEELIRFNQSAVARKLRAETPELGREGAQISGAYVQAKLAEIRKAAPTVEKGQPDTTAANAAKDTVKTSR
jgi:hypothetical protein